MLIAMTQAAIAAVEENKKDLIERAGDSVLEVLEALKQAAPQATEALIRYVWAEGVTGMVLAGLGFVMAGAFLFLSFVCMNIANKRDDEGWGVATIFSFVVALVFIVSSSIGVSDNLPKVLAPDGAALMKVIDGLR